MQTTKILENTTDQDINVLGVGVIKAHDRISVTTEYHAPVNLINYPGVIDVLAEEAKGVPAQAPQTPPQAAAPAPQPGLEGNLEANKVEGK